MTEIPPVGLSKKGGRYNGQFRPEFSRLYEDPDLLLVTPLPVRYLVGVVGRRWSGKSTTVATLHEELGFDNHSLVDIVRATAEDRGLDPTNRRVLQTLADSLRAEHVKPGTGTPDECDAAYLARRMLRRIHDRHVHHSRRLGPPQRIVLSGFGHPDELDIFLRLPQFRMIRLVCEEESREERALAGRARKDAQAFELGIESEDEVFAAVDACDLDGASINAWADGCGCAHSTRAILESVAAITPCSGPDELVEPESLVFDLNTDSSPGEQRDRLEEIARLLDREFRVL